jgi:hypothetical protein
VTIYHTLAPVPRPTGGAIIAGSYVLTGDVLYGAAPPDVAGTGAATQATGVLSAACDQFYESYVETSMGGTGSGLGCYRLAANDSPLAALLPSNDPNNDGTPYTATANTLDIFQVEPLSGGGPYVLGSYAWVKHYALVESAADVIQPPPSIETQQTGARDVRCPTTAPANGSACDPSLGPLECEYGGDAQGRCTTLAACALGANSAYAFAVTQSADCGANDQSCPATFDGAQALPSVGTPTDGGVDPRCLDAGWQPPVSCNYPEGVCSCTSWSAGTGCTCRTRADITLTTGTSCPSQRPLAGDSCTIEDTYCGYSAPCGGPSLGPSMACIGGHWIEYEEFVGCPANGPMCPQP